MTETDLAPPPDGLSLVAPRHADPAAIAAAESTARYWTSPSPGPLRPGSKAHAAAATAMFFETFNPYKPSVIDWPALDQAALARITALPIWNIAVQTEGHARRRMAAFAQTRAAPQWRGAIGLNAWEESRHKFVLSNLVAAYGIALEPEPAYPTPRNSEWAYLVTGFSECIDSFFAFGLFAMAKNSGFFPSELVETFEPVIQEECRHILLFANWLAAHRAAMAWWRRPWLEMQVAAVWVFLAYERMGIAGGLGGKTARAARPDNNFTLTGAQAMTDQRISLADLVALSLAENDRRFAGYDRRLRRPQTMPLLARLALRLIPRPRRRRAGRVPA